jgi:hypothetical protein
MIHKALGARAEAYNCKIEDFSRSDNMEDTIS